MSSYRQILYHIVFRTKNGEKTLPLDVCDDLYKYIWGFIQNKNGFLYRINGMEDHIHILCDLHPAIALADYIRDLKTSTSIWLNKNSNFPHFRGWADGYAALTYSFNDKDTIITYIKNQREHHRIKTFTEELKEILTEQGITYDEKFFP